MHGGTPQPREVGLSNDLIGEPSFNPRYIKYLYHQIVQLHVRLLSNTFNNLIDLSFEYPMEPIVQDPFVETLVPLCTRNCENLRTTRNLSDCKIKLGVSFSW
jgi:hypothetical protein